MPVIFGAVMVNAIPVSLVIPMLPFLGQRYGASAFEIALLFTLMPLVGIIGNPIWGRLSDKIGRRGAMTCTLAGTAIAFVALAFANSLWALYGARALQGAFHGSNAIAIAHISDITGKADRAKGLGRVFGAMGVGLAIGPTLGGFLMGDNADMFSQTLPCLAAATLSVAASLAIFFFLTEPKDSVENKAKMPPDYKRTSTSLKPILTNSALWILALMILISGAKMNAEQLAYPFWAISVEWTPQFVSWGFAVLCLGLLVTSLFLIGPITKRFDEERILLWACIVDLAALVGFLSTSHMALAFLWLIILSISSPLWGTVLISVLSRHAPDGLQGTIQGAATSIQLTGRIIGTLLAGLAMEQYGFFGAYVLMTLLIVFVVTQARLFVLKTRRTA